MDLEIRQIESTLAALRNQLSVCTKDIQNLIALRQLAAQDPRSALKTIVLGTTPKPISIEKLPPLACRSKSRRVNTARPLPKRAITPTSPASSSNCDLASCSAADLKKTSIAKARKLPGYRLFTRTNLEFAREWKDVENNQ